MTTVTITWGEQIDLSITAVDENGDPIVLDGTYSAACQFARSPGGRGFIQPPVSISDGAVQVDVDTRDEVWVPGVYYFDVRITDAGGVDYWSEPIKVVLDPRITPASI